MNVRVLVFATALIAWTATPTHAAEQYRFRVAEGLEALGDEELPPGMAQLRGRPLMVLIGIEGTHWRWMLNGCPQTRPCEWRIDDTGGGGGSGDPEEDPADFTQPRDLGLLRLDATRFRLRCLREVCVIRHAPVGAKEMERIRLLRGGWIELPVERVIDVTFAVD
jgi:hypothetical protein